MKESFEINGRRVGGGGSVYVIAEVGSNHDGSFERAIKMIDASKEAGADCVKFQSFTAEGLLNPLMPDNEGHGWIPHPAYEVIERLTLPEEWHGRLKSHADSVGIDFISAPFDLERADLLTSIDVPAYKLASGDLTYEELLRRVTKAGKPIIISTGAAYMEEVERAVEVVSEAGCDEVALLHCVSLYPPKYEDMNIRAMVAMAERFKCPVGFSDHTPGITVPVSAVTLGASIIEKHITLDRNLPGPDHPYAMEVGEFKSMVYEIRNLELALGQGVKEPAPSEEGERVGARRSIYASTGIGQGELITRDMIKVVRHGHGLGPNDIGTVVDKRAAVEIKKDMPIMASMIEALSD